MSDAAQRMPADLAKAIVKVMGEVKKLGKDTRNDHGKYNYVSVDQFFDQIGKLMSDAGMFVVVNETECETAIRTTVDQWGKEKSSAWLTSHYDIFLYHESGAEYGPIKRTIQVSASGPQSYGSAISFVEKYFLRSLFKIPTGEQDADADAQEGLPANARKTPPVPPPPPVPTAESSAELRDKMIAAILAAKTPSEFDKISARVTAQEANLLDDDARFVFGAIDEKKDNFRSAA
jgi:hypothetical protein